MNVYLLRHAIAVERGDPRYPEDRDRPLTGKGTNKLMKVLEFLRDQEVSPQAIFSSPFVRCAQTAQRASQFFNCALHFMDSLRPGGRFEDLAPALRDFEQVMLIGHEPELGEMAGWLMTGQRAPLVELKKAGVACLTGLVPGHLRLQWLLSPKLCLG